MTEARVLDEPATPCGTFPHVRVAGDLIFVSGTGSRAPDNSIVGASVDEMGWRFRRSPAAVPRARSSRRRI
ncbi:hypothetical protein ABZ260_07635 [Streptosporangium sp. NPDC006013]|uniref:hypothetical protein n=1 Tax=Streptosporangium sp. NPDC006013 TaxID=3155596 RepID=UPI0033B8DB67